MTVLFIAGVAAYGWITYYTVVNVIGISSFYQWDEKGMQNLLSIYIFMYL